MNDPNGLVYLDGEYHLFYQYNPTSSDWGEIGWGHAVSHDLIRWQELDMALPADRFGMAFSGSAVVDTGNTSGLADGDVPTIVTIYTCHASGGRQSQHIAYSNDRGRSWTRYAHNPVLDIDSNAFRDPKVLWHEASGRWIMVVVLADEHQVQFYGSQDLLGWDYLSSFGPAGNTQGAWECPDLISLPVDDDTRQRRWLLKVDNTLGGAAAGSGGQYFVGDFDGTRFQAAPLPGYAGSRVVPMQPLDYGSDFYAAMSWSNVPDGRHLWLGWMSNWTYAGTVPTRPFRGIQSLPRSLRLVRHGDRLQLAQQPVSELEAYRGPNENWRDIPLPEGASLLLAEPPPAALEVLVEIGLQKDSVVALRLRGDGESGTAVICDSARGLMCVDRRHTSADPFHADFAGCHCAPLPLIDDVVRLRLLLDHCCLEIFGGRGEVVISDLLFPDEAPLALTLDCELGDADVVRLDLWPLDVPA